MEKDTRLVNIYLKIFHKKTLTMDDLCYLAQYDPECFQKTCKNVVYNIPESKPVMEPTEAKSPDTESISPQTQVIQSILENLKQLEINHSLFTNVDADKVKNLLGNLYLELLFPHNDKDTFMNFPDRENVSSFDKRA